MKTKDFKRRLVRVAMMLFALVTNTQVWAQATTSWMFSYTGAIQTFTASKAGIYELQVWGAQGGKQGSAGGLGGYATCRTTLAQGEIIYVYVGGKGGDEAKDGGAGGWNGGGKGGAGYDWYNGVGGGGGATHISKVNNQVIGSGDGQCASLVGTDYIIVAGGGGGGSHVWTTPGVGGGTEGGKGTRCNGTNSYEENYSENFYYSTSQSYGASGGNGSSGGWAAEGAGGGGGGYYGGTSNYAYGTFDKELQDAGGCGGNSAYNSSFATNFSTTAGQREGDGQAQITLLVSQDEIDAHVGKVLGSDGKMYKTIAAAQNAGTTASGVIAYWGVAGSVYGTNIGSNYKAIAISIDYPSGVFSWGNGWVSMYTTGNDLATMYANQTGGGAFTSQSGSHGDHPAISAAWNYSTARPSESSMWFLADVGQWNMVVKGLTGLTVSNTNLSTTANSDLAYDKVNVKLTAAGATPLDNFQHWTVSEYENDHGKAWEYLPGGCLWPIEKSYQWLVRPIFTFSSATPAVYTISYDANSGSGAPSSQTKDGGIDITLSSTVPTRSGYTFAGWTVAQDGSGTVYAAGATYDGNEDATLYAQWTENAGTLDQATRNSSFISTNNGLVYDITLGRTLQAGGWNTFCAPFDISSSQITSVFGTGTKVRELGSSDFDSTTKQLTLNFTNATEIEAGKPYLIYIGSSSNVANPTFSDVTISNSTTTTETTYANFVPVMNPTSITGGDKTVLFVTGGNKLTYPNSTGNLNGFRAYFELKEDAATEVRSFIMNFDDETTSISEKGIGNSEKFATAPVYDLQGRKVSDGKWPNGQMPKGVYIVNGKKVVIK